jgi:hypothetical protein
MIQKHGPHLGVLGWAAFSRVLVAHNKQSHGYFPDHLERRGLLNPHGCDAFYLRHRPVLPRRTRRQPLRSQYLNPTSSAGCLACARKRHRWRPSYINLLTALRFIFNELAWTKQLPELAHLIRR